MSRFNNPPPLAEQFRSLPIEFIFTTGVLPIVVNMVLCIIENDK